MVDQWFDAPGVPLFVAAPPTLGPATRVLVAVHGISRNAGQHLKGFSDLAARDCAIIAPLFGESAYPHYQKLGFCHDEPRADLALLTALDALSRKTGLPTRRFDLFGLSGGAQFVHRFAMLNPGRVRTLHVASAGYYTFIDEQVSWPRGLRRFPAKPQADAARRFFLRLPIRVYVGERDIARDLGLRTGPRIDAQQGLHRVARAKAWTAHVAALQASEGFTPARLEILPDCGHDFSDTVLIGDLPRRVLLGCGLAADSPPHPLHQNPQTERTLQCAISGG